MAIGREVSLRFQADTLKRIQAHRDRLRVTMPSGIDVTIADAVRTLVLTGLHAAERDLGKRGSS